MSDSKSIADLSDKEQEERLKRWENWYEDQKKKVESTNLKLQAYPGVMQWDDFRKKYKDETRKNFLMYRHSGGEWEQYEVRNVRGDTYEAWRYVEGNYKDPQEEEEQKKDKDFNIKSNYTPGSSIPDVEPFEIKRDLSRYDDDEHLTPDSKILEPSRTSFRIPKSVIKYAEGSSRPTNTAKMGIQRLRKDVKRKPFK